MALGDVEVTGTKTTRQVNGRTQWVLRVRVCNRTADPLPVKLADNPWRKPADPSQGNLGPKLVETVLDDQGRPDPGATRRKVMRDRWRNPQTGDGSAFTLRPAGQQGDCHTFEFAYDFDPACTYCDVFVIQPNGQPEDAFSGHFTRMWNEVELAEYRPKGPNAQYACLYYLPYPMALESVAKGDVKVVLEPPALPAGVTIAHAFPPFGVAVPLTLGDRDSQAVLFLRRTGIGSGTRTLSIRYRVVEPLSLGDFPPREIEIDIRFPRARRRKVGTKRSPSRAGRR